MPRHFLPGMELTGAAFFTLLSLKIPASKKTTWRLQGLELNDLQGPFLTTLCFYDSLINNFTSQVYSQLHTENQRH